MRNLRQFVLLLILLVSAFPCFALPANVKITEISGFSAPQTYPVFDTPSINEKGDICFKGSNKTASAMFKGDGIQISPVAQSDDGTGLFDQFSSGLCSINDSGDVTFDSCTGCTAVAISPLVLDSQTAAASGPVKYAIYTKLFSAGSPAPLQLIAATGTADTEFNVVALPTINNSGVVSFSGSLINGLEGIWTKVGATFSTFVDSSGIFSKLGGAYINDVSQITFGGIEDGGGDVRGIYGPALNRILGTFNGFTKFSVSAINNKGVTAALGIKSSENGVYLDGQAFLTNRGDFALVDISPFQAVSINDQNDLVFSAVRSDGTQVVFLYVNGGLIPLIQQGELVPGHASPILDMNVGRESLNNSRQVAIAATLQDQTEVILRLDASALVVPADNCPSDNAKFEPGVCGCGVSDADSNGDGILNCKVSAVVIDLTNQLNIAVKKVKKLPSHAKKSAIKTQKDLQKLIKNLVARIAKLGKESVTEVKLTSNKVPLNKLISSLKSKVLKALKTSDRNFVLNRKKALSEIKGFSKKLIL